MRKILLALSALALVAFASPAHADNNVTYGTFVCTSAGSIVVANTNQAITDVISISENTAGGTISTAPSVKTITAGTGFTALCATSDTATYNWASVKYATVP
jgi:hypothetical protein